MKRWMTGRELLERFGLKEFELFELVRNGLQPYSRHDGSPIKCPQRWHVLTAKSKRLQELRNRLQAMESNGQFFDGGPIVIIPGHGEKTAEELRVWLGEEIARTLKGMDEIKQDVHGIASWKYLAVPRDDSLKKLLALLCISYYKDTDVVSIGQQYCLRPLTGDNEPKSGLEEQREEVQLNNPHELEPLRDPDQLDAKERRELGRLRQEEIKRDMMLRAMAFAMEYCIHEKQKTSNQVTRDQLFDTLRSGFKDDLPETAFEKIRLAIRDQFPGKYIKGAGRTPAKQSPIE